MPNGADEHENLTNELLGAFVLLIFASKNLRKTMVREEPLEWPVFCANKSKQTA